MASDMSRSKTTTIQKNDGRYAYETKRPLQLCWLATSGTQEGRIAHHHTDATILRRAKRPSRAPHIVDFSPIFCLDACGFQNKVLSL